MIHIPTELASIYLDKMTHHKVKLSRDEAIRYYSYLCEQGLLSVVLEVERIVAVVEWYRINYSQLGRLICFAPFNIYDEDILSGNITYVSDVWIDEDYRQPEMIKKLRHDLFLANHNCDYFFGEEERKKVKCVKIFKRQEAYSKWALDSYTNEVSEKENIYG